MERLTYRGSESMTEDTQATTEFVKRMNEVIDEMEVYTAGRPNTEKVHISVLQLQRFINALKEIPLAYDEKIIGKHGNGWIPVKTRPVIAEEKGYCSDYGMIYECSLPEDGQEVLITTKYGTVEKTTFYTDYGCYFENYEDCDEVIAWSPLPEPWKATKSENRNNNLAP